MEEKPWPIYKIKLGTDNDIEIITAIKKTHILFLGLMPMQHGKQMKRLKK